ncbi:N-acetylglucosamine kinase [Echinicola rosea]|uniref:ATPase n=1 Tax=Echinicola rosea TaxID=1807691 RepID=A0ABQ1V2J9_9BACT|nr:N-acetylglucosamine kinase [Echinicola rosea]GGF35331.1 ATPase [Echinicola rosea]
MILIADSGSSKTDWRGIDRDGNVSQFRGVGFNPYYQTPEEMATELNDEFLLKLKEEVVAIYYYGAGCSTPENKKGVATALGNLFGNATIKIDHDLLAAARATCGHEEGIACILGTGSNSCDYNGEKIIDSRPSPGFILGDEGGGTYIGKKFLQDFIHDEMPDVLKREVSERFQLTAQVIQDNVYRKPFPGRYMASFCRFITEHISNPYCYLLYYNAFQDFFKKHVIRYENYHKKKVSFVGSVAFYNSDILRKAAADMQIHVHLVLESPIAGLTLYHKENL